MKKYLVFLFSFAILLGAFSFVSAETIALPNPLCPNMANPCVSSPTCVCNFADLVGRVTNYIFTIIGVLAVLMFVIAGIYFVISAGNPEKIQKAKDIAKWAVIGAIIAFAGKGLIELVKAVIGA